MSTKWLPFGHEDMIEVDIVSGVDPVTGLPYVTAKCLKSRVGDVARFCFLQTTNVIWVASPADDDGVPLYPTENEDGASRIDRLKIVLPSADLVEETVNGLLANLDEYIRSKKALEAMVDAEVLTVG